MSAFGKRRVRLTRQKMVDDVKSKIEESKLILSLAENEVPGTAVSLIEKAVTLNEEIDTLLTEIEMRKANVSKPRRVMARRR
jgi:hypothetical protein